VGVALEQGVVIASKAKQFRPNVQLPPKPAGLPRHYAPRNDKKASFLSTPMIKIVLFSVNF
jgi:hypothetical protein